MKAMIVLCCFLFIFALVIPASAAAERSPDIVIFCYKDLECKIIYESEPILSSDIIFTYQALYYPPYIKHTGSYHIPNLPPGPILVPSKPTLFYSTMRTYDIMWEKNFQYLVRQKFH